jgi:sialate O-acetylesterase
MRRFIPLCLILWTALAGQAPAAVKPNPLISEGMVLQQGRKVSLWGKADAGEKVVVSFQGREAEITAKDGAWTLELSDLKAGGPFEMTIRGENVIHLKEVYVGEVWLCAGQMNMDWPLHLAADGERAVSEALNPNVHLFQVRYTESAAPLGEVQGAWKECTPVAAADFSAAAYFFGRDLQRRLGVPVGLIQATTAASAAEGWTTRPALEKDPKTREIVQKYDEAEKEFAGRVDRFLDEYQAKVRKAVAKAQDVPASRPPENTVKELQRPGGLYNGMIAPLQPYALRGVAWYQGESDVRQPARYQALLTAVVKQWRSAWKQDNLPFLIVQLAPAGRPRAEPRDSAWAEVRDAQRLVSHAVPHTALIVTADIGAVGDVHPPDKAPVGVRLTLAARALAYSEKVLYSGPVYGSFRVEKDVATVTFTGASGGLAPRDAPVRGFTVAGEDHRFVKADAVVRGDTAVVSSPCVSCPKAVRYGWTDYPTGNLADGTGLPAAPFRTDDFPLNAPAPKPDDEPATRSLTRGIPDGALKVHVPGVQQHDNYSCGAAALMAVCSSFGVGPEELEDYKKKLGTNEENGTNVYEMLKMARELGLTAEIRHNMKLDELRKCLDDGAPVICSIQAYGDPDSYYRDDNGHYVVAVGYDEGNFYFEDPVLPGRDGFLPVKEFDRRWHDDEGTTEKPDPHAHLGLIVRRKRGEPVVPSRARKVD